MGNKAWENAHAERVNGIVKNEYLIPQGIKTFKHLVSSLRQAVKKINEERPHGKLPMRMTPCAFEEMIRTRPNEVNYEVKINY